jgi:predicted TIM-barrel fold metal-dependent hydrolase
LSKKFLFGALSLGAGLLFILVNFSPSIAQTVAPHAGPPPYNGPMNSVLLKDYDPIPSLVVPEHHPAKARFPAIDVHSHAYVTTPQQVAELVRAMDDTGVEKVVILTMTTGEEFDRLVDVYLKPYPTRFLLYCGIDTRHLDISAPDYPQKVVRELERCYRKGARGVGEIHDKGAGVGGSNQHLLPRDKRMHLDDPRLDAFWDKCAELKLPVSIHVADHPSAWKPDDRHQERLPGYQRYNQYGVDVPSYEELLLSRDRLLDKHPRTTFIMVHLSNQGNDLAALSKVMDKYQNLNLDISARDYELGREPFSAPAFLAKYKNRILWGTDQTPSREMYRRWWRLLETRDEFIKSSNWWRLYGLGLPDDVLEPLYRGNALRILNWTPVN